MADSDRRTEGEVLERTREQLKKPELFKVLLLNDDYTTMDFVVEILESVFHKQPAEAYRIMMMVHTQGKGLCGVYPFEVAERKGDSRDRAPGERVSVRARWSRSSAAARARLEVAERERVGVGPTSADE